MSLENIKKLREMTGAGFADVKKALDETNNDLEKASEWLRKQGIAKAAKKASNIAAEGIVTSFISGNKAVMVEINSQTDFVAKNVEFVEFANEVAKQIAILPLEKIKELKTVEQIKSEIKINDVPLAEVEISMTAKIGEKISFRRFAVVNSPVVSNYNHSNGRVAVILGSDSLDSAILRDICMHAAAMAPKFKNRNDVSETFINKETEILKDQYAKSMADKPANILENIVKGAVNKQIAEIVLDEQQFVKDPSKKVKDLLGSSTLTSYVRFEVGEGIEKSSNNFAEEVAKAAGIN